MELYPIDLFSASLVVCQGITTELSYTLVGKKIVDHSDVVASSFSTLHLASRDSAKKAARQYENLLSVGIWCDLY